jgi:hypothetical protein
LAATLIAYSSPPPEGTTAGLFYRYRVSHSSKVASTHARRRGAETPRLFGTLRGLALGVVTTHQA